VLTRPAPLSPRENTPTAGEMQEVYLLNRENDLEKRERA
jgi:hypothetical protein